MKFKLDPKWYLSIDARPDILAAVPELIPDDYYKVIDFYDRFRRMTSYKRGLGHLGSQNSLSDPKPTEIDSEELPPSGHKLLTTDTRDKLIRELESRLSGCLKQIELTDDYNRELVDLFTKQSAEVLDLTRRLNQQTADKQTTETAKRLAENQEIFALKKQLADAQTYIARCQMLGTDIARLETELTDSQLETQKYKDLAQGLTDQLLGVKRELRDKSAEHAAGIKTSTRDMSRIAGLEKDNTRLTQDNLAAQNKIRDLETQILRGNINSKPEKETLEQVLITKCDDLTRDRDELSRKYSELVKANKQLERDYEEFRGSITRLMTGR
jgi:chromosome segregation ATPase